jgi:hypothetical protein
LVLLVEAQRKFPTPCPYFGTGADDEGMRERLGAGEMLKIMVARREIGQDPDGGSEGYLPLVFFILMNYHGSTCMRKIEARRGFLNY